MADSEATEQRRLNIRLESLSDLVFGLALSIGALLLALSNVSSPSQLESNIVTFGFSFLILIYVWMRYTSILGDMPESVKQKSYVARLSTVLLFLVVIEPYLYDILHEAVSSAVLASASTFYALDVGTITLILAVLILFILHEDYKSHKKITLPKAYFYICGGSIGISVIMYISAIPIFWQFDVLGLQARFFMWILIFPLMFLGRFVSGLSKRKKEWEAKNVRPSSRKT